MNNKRLWAPWRITYIRKESKSRQCIFCHKKDYLIFSTKYSICMLNIYPYNNGHLLVSPRSHINDIAKLSEPQALDLFKAVIRAKKLLEKTLTPQGFNIGMNTSPFAGAGIASHIHIHIVPRWKGDTNFMPVVSGTKVISQSLKELHSILTHAESK